MSEITGETSDGFHTFNELYAHRNALWIAYCALLKTALKPVNYPVWRTIKHSDGTSIEGYFLLGVGDETPETQATYHLPMEKWDQCRFADTLERAPKFDGHTSEDVLNRLQIDYK